MGDASLSSTGQYGCQGSKIQWYGGADADDRRRRSPGLKSMESCWSKSQSKSVPFGTYTISCGKTETGETKMWHCEHGCPEISGEDGWICRNPVSEGPMGGPYRWYPCDWQ